MENGKCETEEVKQGTVKSPFRWLVGIGIVCCFVGLAIWSYTSGGIVAILVGQGEEGTSRLTAVQEYVQGYGAAAPLAYLALVIVEVVVAPIPGTMLYAPGGAIFGGFLGGALSLLGNTLGAGIACYLMRTLGQAGFLRWFSREKMNSMQTLLERRGFWIVLLLRLNPFTSSDLVSYATGLTEMPVWQVMLATAFGMAPLCFAQSYLSQQILTAFPALFYPILIACLIYTVLAIWIIVRLAKPQPAQHGPR